jgi:exonuclease SbcC
MIEYIEVKNFQSHRHSRIELCSGTTAITGLSMNGKTAIKRAFEWVRNNRPTGFRFNYRYADDPTVVEIGVDGGFVRLEKSTKGSKYIVKDKGRYSEHKAFGTSVPPEVTELLGVSDISIQDQLDAYLLVISSAGEIARTINRITGIDIGDKWIKEINQATTSLTREDTKLEGEVDFLREEIKKYDGVGKAKAWIDHAVQKQSEYDAKLFRNNSLTDLINSYAAAEKESIQIRQKILPLQACAEDLSMLINLIKEKIELKKMCMGISALSINLEEVRRDINLMAPMVNVFKYYQQLKIDMDGIKGIIKDYNAASKSRIECATAIADTIEAIKAELVKRAGRCWVCGQLVSNMDKMIENLVMEDL